MHSSPPPFAILVVLSAKEAFSRNLSTPRIDFAGYKNASVAPGPRKLRSAEEPAQALWKPRVAGP